MFLIIPLGGPHAKALAPGRVPQVSTPSTGQVITFKWRPKSSFFVGLLDLFPPIRHNRRDRASSRAEQTNPSQSVDRQIAASSGRSGTLGIASCAVEGDRCGAEVIGCPVARFCPYRLTSLGAPWVMRALCGVGDGNRRADALFAGPHATWRAELNAQR